MHLIVTESDLQTSISATLQVSSGAQVNVAIPARTLLDTVKNLPEQPINVEINPNSYTISIYSDNGVYKLAGEGVHDFPQSSTIHGGIHLEVNMEVWKSVLHKTMFATSNNELKPAMCGVGYIKQIRIIHLIMSLL